MSRRHMKPTRMTVEQVTEQCRVWNRDNRIGSVVDVQGDDGTTTQTNTRTEAFVLGGHTAVVMLESQPAAYRLDRCRRAVS